MKGSEVSASMKEALQAEHAALRAKGIEPKLAIVRVGARGDDLAYERGALKRFEGLGIAAQVYELPEDIDQRAFDSEFGKINADPAVHGILLFRPLPKHLDGDAPRRAIDPRKDVDGMSPLSAAKVFAGEDDGFAPCTPGAVMEMLEHFKIDPKGKNVTIVGRSMVVGRPLAMLMLAKHATVTICHTRTVDMPSVCRRADILVAAAGKAGMIGADCVTDRSIVVDVGINVDAEGKLCGDVDFAAVEPIVSMISPVPGGVGAVTTSVLAKNVLKAARLQTH
ncbi:bifunctional 5,10-methylenetetrahydrofolate dehydrogenase/5,10-methenyltetrahydrofolate cyclohydrolase [Fretibacterium sp. OH1220_COT-178]|uniref:bifunctional 5,10-methylenetetrahydrofolate dehydrogenase/5,10-methenyltetrahydrofolate cyclohydrolase n=1 Tax=Fretibacterium sp. OH1220_COT-178 TaxID=2491047 RepID=UPI001F40D9AD|nr:bifunctional 5,10-methylenetetrahydrofolate dehydrogenase/5,10-methenyltetrahydrofolate cyclohydrolase [Fretibacterium sp. OH1220_COT-178]